MLNYLWQLHARDNTMFYPAEKTWLTARVAQDDVQQLLSNGPISERVKLAAAAVWEDYLQRFNTPLPPEPLHEYHHRVVSATPYRRPFLRRRMGETEEDVHARLSRRMEVSLSLTARTLHSHTFSQDIRLWIKSYWRRFFAGATAPGALVGPGAPGAPAALAGGPATGAPAALAGPATPAALAGPGAATQV